MKCHHCGSELPPKDYPGRARRWCGAACKSAARRARRSVAPDERPLRLDCLGCGLPLAPQRALRGSPLRYHHECQVVMRRWQRCHGVTVQMSRYRELRRAGASSYMARFGMIGRYRFDAVLETQRERDPGR